MAKSQALPSSVINMGRPKGGKPKAEVIDNLVPVRLVDKAYSDKLKLEAAEAAFKDTAEKLKARAASFLNGQGSCTLPGTSADAQIVVRHAILGVTNPEMAMAIAGDNFHRYVDEQVESVIYTVANMPIVMGALKACGIEETARRSCSNRQGQKQPTQSKGKDGQPQATLMSRPQLT